MAASASLKDLWSQGAPAYAEFSGEGGLKPLHEQVLALIIRIERAQGRLKVLDVACGDGEPACSIAKRLPLSEVIATDFAPGMVELASRRAASLNLKNIRFAVADAMDLGDYPSNHFDVVTCVAALMMVPDCSKVLQEFKRVLKPGGLLVATVWGTPEETNIASAFFAAKAKATPPAEQPESSPPSRLGTREGFSEIVGEADFSRIHIKDFNLEFRFPADSFQIPDGNMLTHPMTTSLTAQLKAAGVDNPVEALVTELQAICTEQGYIQADGGMVFPRNVAIIATAIA